MSREEFLELLYFWAERLKVRDRISSVHFRKMKRKLASCSSRGRLTFDLSLLEKDKERVSYVIVHELLHLRYPNHGKLFKLVCNAYLKRL